MQVDENDFFRRATMQICSSLDIEIAMWRSIQFLREFIPVDMMFLHLYERDLGAMRTIAMATASARKKDRPAHSASEGSPDQSRGINIPTS